MWCFVTGATGHQRRASSYPQLSGFFGGLDTPPPPFKPVHSPPASSLTGASQEVPTRERCMSHIQEEASPLSVCLSRSFSASLCVCLCLSVLLHLMESLLRLLPFPSLVSRLIPCLAPFPSLSPSLLSAVHLSLSEIPSLSWAPQVSASLLLPPSLQFSSSVSLGASDELCLLICLFHPDRGLLVLLVCLHHSLAWSLPPSRFLSHSWASLPQGGASGPACDWRGLCNYICSLCTHLRDGFICLVMHLSDAVGGWVREAETKDPSLPSGCSSGFT